MQESETRYLTTAQVAKLLMVSPGSVRLWIGDGLLRAKVTPGGHRRILRSDLEIFARERGLVLAVDRTNRFRVLIVEDDEQFATYLEKVLSRLTEAVQVAVAHSGFDAGFLARDFAPDVILLDLMMPTLDGFEACKRLKQEPLTKDIRIVAMTGYYSAENLTRIVSLGASECLTKPFEADELLRAIGLQGAKLRRSHAASTGHTD